MAPPSGLARKPIAKLPYALRVPLSGSWLEKEQLVEDQRGRGAVQKKIIPLDRRADEAGEDDAPDM
jgi:hypothetical protein